jgi:hypothetical protein
MKRILRKLRSNMQLNESLGQSSDSVAPSPIDTTDAIFAFRTITTMLALIQSPNEIARTGRKEDLSDKRRELRVLDALAAVAVRQHEIVAVMAKNDGFKIEVIVSVNEVGPALNVPQPQNRHDSGSLPIWRPRWFITPNPRDPKRKANRKFKIDSLTTEYQCMTLVHPDKKISESLSKASPDKLLDIFLETEW